MDPCDALEEGNCLTLQLPSTNCLADNLLQLEAPWSIKAHYGQFRPAISF